MIQVVNASTPIQGASESGDFKVTLINNPFFPFPVTTTGTPVSFTLKLEYKTFPVMNLASNDLPVLLIFDEYENFIQAIYFTEQSNGVYHLNYFYQSEASKKYVIKIDAKYSLDEYLTLDLGNIWVFFFPFSTQSFISIMLYLITFIVLGYIISRYLLRKAKEKQMDNERLISIGTNGSKVFYSLGVLLVPLIFLSTFIAGIWGYIVAIIILSVVGVTYQRLPTQREQALILFGGAWIAWIIGTFLFWLIQFNAEFNNSIFAIYYSWLIYFFTCPFSNILVILKLNSSHKKIKAPREILSNI
ncbi:MAG: hypothetical protein EAX96_06360 [Candidatus Lokiarchaeota archaeon]|nr:hypothetical protein [Candidatus Lokiarchaeota archaeon]